MTQAAGSDETRRAAPATAARGSRVAAKALKRRPHPSGPVIDESQTRIYYWWLLLAILFEYVRPGAFVPVIGAIRLGTIIPGALLVITLIAPGLRPWGEIFSDRFVKWLVAYLLLIALSVPTAEVTLYAYNILTDVLTHLTMFVMIARIATSLDRVRGIFASLIAAHVVLVLLNPALLLTPDVRSYVRGAPFLGDGNDFALSMCILLPMAIEIARRTHGKLTMAIGWVSVACIFLAIIATQSRGASLAVAAVLLVLWRYSNNKLLSLGAILLVGVFVLVYASDAYFNRMSTIAHYEQDGSAEGRIKAWKGATAMAVDHPLTGVGAGQFPAMYGRHYREEGSGKWLTAHSMYFLVLGELGFPGILVLLALVWGSPLALLSLRRRVLAATHGPPLEWRLESERFLCMLAAGCIGFAVAGAFLSVSYYPHIFVLTAVTASARLIVKSGLESPQPAAQAPTESTPAQARRRLPVSIKRRRRN